MFSRILGTHVQRLATIAHGDGVCTTFIPKVSTSKAHTNKSQNKSPNSKQLSSGKAR
jgi:hypothetical protein